MPLHFFEGPLNSLEPGKVSEQYIIFYASVVDGVMWCPDCRAVDDIVKRAFSPQDGPSGLIVYAGDRAEWKSPSNVLREEPWKVTDLPTITRIKDGARLVESEMIDGLSSFLKEGTSSGQQ